MIEELHKSKVFQWYDWPVVAVKLVFPEVVVPLTLLDSWATSGQLEDFQYDVPTFIRRLHSTWEGAPLELVGSRELGQEARNSEDSHDY